MKNFIDCLNASSVTYVRDLTDYGWLLTGPGYEAISPFGEIKAFATYAEAQAWRVGEVKTYSEMLGAMS